MRIMKAMLGEMKRKYRDEKYRGRKEARGRLMERSMQKTVQIEPKTWFPLKLDMIRMDSATI